MKRIRIITCHDVYNVGALLQAYALSSYLKSLGNEVKIIDYKPEYLSGHYKLFRISNEKYNKAIIKYLYLLIKLPQRLIALIRKQKFDRFRQKFLELTDRYTSIDELRNNPPESDIYIAGSDQIWNPIFQNGKDEAFYLNFGGLNIKRVSYAASFSVDKLTDDQNLFLKTQIQRFNNISVRESSGIKILNNIDIMNVYHVLDPIFLISIDEWIKISKQVTKNEKYIFIYDFEQNELIKQIAIKLSKKYNLKIYTLFSTKYADKTFPFLGPEEFIGMIYNSSYVISNSFHATAFSVLFNKKFLVINRNTNINSRMVDFVSGLGLNNTICKSSDPLLDLNFNWNIINAIINKKIEYSKKFLLESIK